MDGPDRHPDDHRAQIVAAARDMGIVPGDPVYSFVQFMLSMAAAMADDRRDHEDRLQQLLKQAEKQSERQIAEFEALMAAAKQPPAGLTDKQAAAIGRQLLGGCEAWSRRLVRASLWRSWALLAVAALAVLVLGIGIGWRLYAPPAELTCADQTDGSRICYMYARLPTPQAGTARGK
jgi:anti-sigma-K factor RskA